MLTAPPGHAIDTMLARLFPQSAEQLEDDLAAILVNLKQSAIVAEPYDAPANRQQQLAARPLQRGRRGDNWQPPLLFFHKGAWGAASRAGGCGEPRATLPSTFTCPNRRRVDRQAAA
jgi:hypothetical protein